MARAADFYLNVSNYQYSPNLVQYGTWISRCIAMGPGSRIAQRLGEWTGVALSNYGVWSDDSDDPALNTSGINLRYSGLEATTHFMIDTSRNGRGPWAPPAGVYPDAQDWCNPTGRGAGLRPTPDTGNALVDAYLWVKIPGESDGECARGLGPTGTEDPEWGLVDPQPANGSRKWRCSSHATPCPVSGNPPRPGERGVLSLRVDSAAVPTKRNRRQAIPLGLNDLESGSARGRPGGGWAGPSTQGAPKAMSRVERPPRHGLRSRTATVPTPG